MRQGSRPARLAFLLLATMLAAGLTADGVRAQERLWRLDLGVPLTYFIAPGEEGTGFEPGDPELAEWAIRSWVDRLPVEVTLVPAPEDVATIRVYWVNARMGLYGEMRPAVREGRPAADVFVRPDVTGLGPDIARAAAADPLFRDTIVYLTNVHELGHAFGLGHTAEYDDIMFSFQYGGDFVEYFRRFRRKLEGRHDIPLTSPFAPGDLDGLNRIYGPGS